MTFWQSQGKYEYEVKQGPDGGLQYTGWIREKGGGEKAWNFKTGKTRNYYNNS